jgi:hypothetical protein
MYPFEVLLGLMFLFWGSAVMATFLENEPKPALSKF